MRLELERLEERLALDATFHVAGGEIVAPNGSAWVAHGINYPEGAGDPNQIIQLFPGTNFVRLNCLDFPSATSLSSFVNTLTSHGIVVELDSHQYPLGAPYTGAALAQEDGWASQMAAAFKDNPYVWFGSQNEPKDAAGLTTEQVDFYNAVRNTGNNNPVILEAGVDASSNINGVDPSAYAGMHNIIWDDHFSGGDIPGVNDPAAVQAQLTNRIATIQTIHSADGQVPVLMGEFSPSTDSAHFDPNGQAAINAATTYAVSNGLTSGWAAWYWGTDPNDTDSLTHDGVTLTPWGQQVAALIQDTSSTAVHPPVALQPQPQPQPAANNPVAVASAVVAQAQAQVQAQVNLLDKLFTIAIDGAELALEARGVTVPGAPSLDALWSQVNAMLPQAGPYGIPALMAGANAVNQAIGG